MDILAAIRDTYIKRFGTIDANQQIISYAPGRVEILGNHTDYNDGFVLTAAIEQKTFFIGQATNDDSIQLVAHDLNESLEFKLNQLPDLKKGHWGSYLVGVIKVLSRQETLKKGYRVAFGSTVPFAAGCSSSASLEAGFLYFLKALEGFQLPTAELAKICQKAENEFAGVPCGLMDQWSVIHGKRNELIFFDCRTLQTQTVKISVNPFSLLIINTNIKHTLVDSMYRKRREECTEAVTICQKNGLAITHLRDLKVSDLPVIKPWMSENVWKRACHVVQENDRISHLMQLPLEKRHNYIRHAMAASHESSKKQFENSCPELDFIEEFCRHADGCFGAKLSGGGFGGCVVALVNAENIESIKIQLLKSYKQHFKDAKPLSITTSSPGEGAGVR